MELAGLGTDDLLGAIIEQVRDATGWYLRVADDLGETRAPASDELAALRALKTKGES